MAPRKKIFKVIFLGGERKEMSLEEIASLQGYNIYNEKDKLVVDFNRLKSGSTLRAVPVTTKA